MIEKRDLAGELTKDHLDKQIRLEGWVQKRRDLGGLIFVDLRDRTGIIQIVFNPDVSAEALKIAEAIRSEYVLGVEGSVVAREEGPMSARMKTGESEVVVD